MACGLCLDCELKGALYRASRRSFEREVERRIGVPIAGATVAAARLNGARNGFTAPHLPSAVLVERRTKTQQHTHTTNNTLSPGGGE